MSLRATVPDLLGAVFCQPDQGWVPRGARALLPPAPGAAPSCRTQGQCAEMQVYHLRMLGTSSSRQLSLKTALHVTPVVCKGTSVL